MSTCRYATAHCSPCLAIGVLMAVLSVPAVADDICTQWGLQGPVYLVQTNDVSALLLVEQTGSLFKGTAARTNKQQSELVFVQPTRSDSAPVVGTLAGSSFQATVYWTNKAIGVYTGRVGPQGLLVGRTYDKTHPATSADFHSDKPLVCLKRVQATSPYDDLLAKMNARPRVLAPSPGSAYRAQTAVTIRVAPGKAAKDASYELEIQRNLGAWRALVNIPVNAAAAQAGLGYTGWGAPVNGADPQMTASVGSYRVRARATAPSPSVPSEWVEFKIVRGLGDTQDAVARNKPGAAEGARTALGLPTKAAITQAPRAQAHGAPLPAGTVPIARPVPPQLNVPTTASLSATANKGDAVALNPQPLPPKADAMHSPVARAVSKANAVSLNPQPPPPASPVVLPNQAPSALR